MAQRMLHEAVDSGIAVGRQPVRVVWWMASAADVRIAVYPPGAEPGKALMVFPVGDQLADEGSAEAEVLGEVGTNAACAVTFADGRVIWPRYNPVAGLWAPELGAPELSRPGGGRRLVILLAALWAGALTVIGIIAERIGPGDGAAPYAKRAALIAGLAVIPIGATRWRLRSRRRSR